MSGKRLMIALLAFTAVFAAGLWYAQFYAFYEEYTVQRVAIGGAAYDVAGFQGIDASTSPLKLRACFTLGEAPDAPEYPDPTPLIAPGWFECFDASALTAAIEAGAATAYLAERGEGTGVDRVVLRFPDGRAFMWRQLQPEFADR
ncbi:MAG: DUF6446 family protein [Pseudomonadota bacterium]